MVFHKPRPIGFNDGTRLWDTELDDFQDQLVQAIDGYGGGEYPPSTDIYIKNTNGAALKVDQLETQPGASSIIGGHLLFTGGNDITFDALTNVEVFSTATVTFTGTTNLPKIGARNYVFAQPLVPLPTSILWVTSPGKWGFAQDNGDWVQIYVDSDYKISFALTRLPNLGKLVAVKVNIVGSSAAGSGSHSSVPATPPKATLFARTFNSTTPTTLGAEVTDNPGSNTNYDGIHVLSSTYDAGLLNYTWSGLNEVINSSTSYWINIKGETGANSVNNSLGVVGITAIVECSEIAPG